MTSTTLETRRENIPTVWWIVLIVLALAGLVAWGVEISRGMADLGIGQQVVWGLYIAGFFTVAGAGSGFLAFAGWSELRGSLRPSERFHLLSAALVCYILAALLIAMDLGSPLQAWRIAFSGQWSSLMVWDFYVLLVAGIVTLISWFSARGGTWGRSLAWIGAVLAVALVVVESWLLASQASHPFWTGGLIVVSFLVSALVAALGLALVILPAEHLELARRWLVAGLVAGLVFLLAEVLTGALVGQPRTAEEIRTLVLGSASPLFWLYVVLGLGLPLVLLTPKAPARAQVVAGGLLATLGVLLEKTQLLAVGQAQPWLPLPEGTYLPSWVEVLAVAGIVALGVIVYHLLSRTIHTPTEA